MCRPIRYSPLSIAISLLLASNMAAAQSNDAVNLDSVSVTGVRASIQQSLVEKHSAAGIVDAISAEDIGKFPDLNLSESLQRIPGVTVDRNNIGEGSTINLRGLGPTFTQVEINGMPGMSNGGESRTSYAEGSRGFNFEMFASELFSSAVVYKTGMAEIDEGGLAGTVRLETPRPLEGRQGTRVVGSFLGNYSERLKSTDPRASVLFSHNSHDVFGITASVAYSQSDFVSNVVQATSWVPFALSDITGIAPGADPRHDEIRDALAPFGGPTYYVFREDRETLGSTLTLQFRPNEHFNFTLDGLYGTLENTRLRLRNDIPVETGVREVRNAVIENGVIVSGDFFGVEQHVGPRHLTADETYMQLVAKMEWTPNEWWSIRPSLGYASRDTSRTFDMYSFRLADKNGNFDPGTLSYRIRGDFIDFGSDLTDGYSNPEDFLFNSLNMFPSRNKDTEKQVRLDIARNFSGNDHVLKFGLRHNERNMDRWEELQILRRDPGVPPSAVPGLDRVYTLVDFKVPGSRAPKRLLSVDKDRFREVFWPGGVPIDGLHVADYTGTNAQSTYTIQEKTSSFWVQMDFQFEQWTLIPGIRHIRTDQMTTGSWAENSDFPDQVIIPVRVSKTYDGYLPSLSVRYDVNHQVVLRTSYARSITRPNPADLMPGLQISGTINGLGFLGNPELEPYYAHNLDFGGEWYFSEEGLLAANVFYKKISNFIDTRAFVDDYSFPSREEAGVRIDTQYTFLEPVNAVSADIKGLEVSLQSRFSRLPGALSNMGGILNYTHTESSADFGDDGDVRNRGLPGLSKNSANATLYYDDGRFDARLAYTWRDRYLAQFGELGGVPRFTKPYGQLDLSLNYQINSHFSIQAQVLNLSKQQRIDQSSTDYLPFAVSTIDRRFMLGVRMAF